jgi:hypothetical protein
MQVEAVYGDAVLARHLVSARAYDLCISRTIHTDMMGSVGYIILRHIVDELDAAGLLSVVTDGTTYLAGHKQSMAVIHYVFESNILEQFICFAKLSQSR